MYYNFTGLHQTVRLILSIPIGLGDHVQGPEEMVMMADSCMRQTGKRGPYKKTGVGGMNNL